jgi:hypothetical protein
VGVICVPEDASRDVASAADGDHQIRAKLIEDVLRRLLAELVHLRWRVGVSQDQEKEKEKGKEVQGSRSSGTCHG